MWIKSNKSFSATLLLWAVASVLVGTDPASAQGSNSAASTCTLCADESTPPVDLDVVVFQKLVEGVNLTCKDLIDQASAISDPTSEDCAKMQREGLALCSCPAPEDAAPCTLCQDGAPSYNASIEFVQDFGCGVIATYVTTDTRPNACHAYQSTVGVYCGCPYDAAEAEDEPVCHLCGEGKLLPEPGRFVQHTDGSDKEICSNLEFDATRVYGTCANVTAMYGEACCKPTPEGAPALGDVVIIENGTNDKENNSTAAPEDDDETKEDMDNYTTSAAPFPKLSGAGGFIYVSLGLSATFSSYTFDLL